MTYPKMHSWKLVIFYLVAACSLSKEVQAKSWASVGNFDIVESDTLCAAFAKYSFDGRSDVKLMLMLGEDDLPFLTVTSLDWSAQDGTEYPGVTYALNGFVYSDYKDDDGKW